MLLSFSWYKYSVVIGCLKKKVKAVVGVAVSVAPDKHWSGISWPVRSEGRESESSKVEKEQAAEKLFELAMKVKAKLSVHIRRCAIKNLEKQELLLSLYDLLKPYTALAVRQAYAFRVAINNTMEVEVEKYYSFHLSGEDLSELWQPRGE